jgi:hypothetical protein
MERKFGIVIVIGTGFDSFDLSDLSKIHQMNKN